MRFEEAYTGWQGKRLTQQEAWHLFGVDAQSGQAEEENAEIETSLWAVDIQYFIVGGC